MRRLVLELYGAEFERRLQRSSFSNIESMKLVHLLHYDQKDGLAAIWKVTPKNLASRAEDIFRNDGSTKELQVLERESGGSSIIFMKRKSTPGTQTLFSHDNVMSGGGYLFGPFDFKNGRLKVTFVGGQSYVRRIFREFESHGIKYRVLSATDADFADDSLLNRLTGKQRETLLLAYELGYFDVPRKINSKELAVRMNLKRSTVVEHLRKAERRILTEIVKL